MALMSYRKYAEHRGCVLRAVQKAIADGRITAALVAVPGQKFAKIDSDKADALWVRNTDETKRSLLFSSGPESAAEKNIPPAAEDAPADADGAPAGVAAAEEDDQSKIAYRLQRTERERIAVELAQIELDERKGKLISIDDAAELAATSLRILRDALRNIGVRNGAMLAELKDPFECARLIDEEIDAALATVTVDAILTPQSDDDEGEAS